MAVALPLVLVVAAGLLVAAADPDPLEALYALPAYNPEEHR